MLEESTERWLVVGALIGLVGVGYVLYSLKEVLISIL